MGAAGRGASKASTSGARTDDGRWLGTLGEEVPEDVGRMLSKLARGEALSNKERRLQKAYEEEVGRARPLNAGYAGTAAPGDEYGLGNFSLSLATSAKASAGGSGGVTEDAAIDNAKDVVIENFTINAHQKELFKNATLRVVHGRRYGLIGPNGQGA